MERVVLFIHNNYKKVVVSVTLVIVLGSILIGDVFGDNSVNASISHQKYYVCIEINEGDTLWSIADTYVSEEYSSVDEYVDEIMELNELKSDKIFCGATLVVPYYAP